MTQPPRVFSLGQALQRYALVILWVAVLVYFSVRLPGSFPSAANFRNIIGGQSVLAIICLAAIVPLTAGQFDLSIGSVMGLCSIATASMLAHGAPLWLAVGVGIGIGAAVGVINGLVIVRLDINPLITTLGVATIISGFISWYTGGMSIIEGIPSSLIDFGCKDWLGLPRTLYVLVVVALLTWYLLEHTPFGRYLHAIGSNPLAARLVGINVGRTVLRSYVISGAMLGFAGVLQVARLGGGNPQIGNNYLLPALSAVFLGATSIQPGRFNVPGTLIAVFFIATTVSGFALSGVDNWVESIFNGAALVVAVAASTLLGRRRAR